MSHIHYLEMLIRQEADGDIAYEKQLRDEVFDYMQGDGPDYYNLTETAQRLISVYENYRIECANRGM